jgi:hypothetical protein
MILTYNSWSVVVNKARLIYNDWGGLLYIRRLTYDGPSQSS